MYLGSQTPTTISKFVSLTMAHIKGCNSVIVFTLEGKRDTQSGLWVMQLELFTNLELPLNKFLQQYRPSVL